MPGLTRAPPSFNVFPGFVCIGAFTRAPCGRRLSSAQEEDQEEEQEEEQALQPELSELTLTKHRSVAVKGSAPSSALKLQQKHLKRPPHSRNVTLLSGADVDALSLLVLQLPPITSGQRGENCSPTFSCSSHNVPTHSKGPERPSGSCVPQYNTL